MYVRGGHLGIAPGACAKAFGDLLECTAFTLDFEKFG